MYIMYQVKHIFEEPYPSPITSGVPLWWTYTSIPLSQLAPKSHWVGVNPTQNSGAEYQHRILNEILTVAIWTIGRIACAESDKRNGLVRLGLPNGIGEFEVIPCHLSNG